MLARPLSGPASLNSTAHCMWVYAEAAKPSHRFQILNSGSTFIVNEQKMVKQR
jgi:hypothetical protein